MPSQVSSCSWVSLFPVAWEAGRPVPAFPALLLTKALQGCTCIILAREEPAEDNHDHLLPSLFTSPLSSCHVCLQTSKLNNCQCRHSWGLITMTNVASWLLYALLSTTICCCFAYQSITVNQGISSSLLHPTPISASFS